MAEDAVDSAQAEFTEQEKALLNQFEQKYGRIIPFRIEGHGIVVLRKPTRAQWRKFKGQQKNESGLIDVGLLEEQVVKECMCHCGTSTFDAILDDYPGLQEILLLALGNLATGTNDQVQTLGKDWKRPVATT